MGNGSESHSEMELTTPVLCRDLCARVWLWRQFLLASLFSGALNRINPPPMEKCHPRPHGCSSPNSAWFHRGRVQESTGPSLSSQGQGHLYPHGVKTSVSPRGEDHLYPHRVQTTFSQQVCSSWMCLNSHHFMVSAFPASRSSEFYTLLPAVGVRPPLAHSKSPLQPFSVKVGSA